MKEEFEKIMKTQIKFDNKLQDLTKYLIGLKYNNGENDLT